MNKKTKKAKVQAKKFTLDCTHPVEDGIMDLANFVSWFIFNANYISRISIRFNVLAAPNLVLYMFYVSHLNLEFTIFVLYLDSFGY